MECVQEIKFKTGKVLKIYQDDSAESPRDWDNLGEIVCFHSRYNIGDSHNYKDGREFSYDTKKGDVVLPIYLYDHSGITIRTEPFNDAWDSGQVGYIRCSKKKMIEEYDKSYDPEKIKEYLKGEVKTLDQYLKGEVYGYTLLEPKTCEHCNHTEEEEIDSCWGFYGQDIKTNGMLDNLPEAERFEILGYNNATSFIKSEDS